MSSTLMQPAEVRPCGTPEARFVERPLRMLKLSAPSAPVIVALGEDVEW